MTRLRQHPFLAIFGAIALLLLLLAALWDWNWFNPLVARAISKQLGRPVTMARFAVRDIVSGSPVLEFDGVTVANPPDFPSSNHMRSDQLGTIDRLAIRIAARPLLRSFGHDIVLRDVTIERLRGDLRASPKGERNWAFALPGTPSTTPRTVRIAALTITDGDFRFNDPKLKADLQVKIATEPARDGGEPQLVAQAQGTYAGQPFKADFTGGSLLSLRDPKRPYTVALVASDGGTRIAVKGTVTDAAQLAGANLEMDLAGQDLAQLYPILGVPLAETPPYALRGHLDYGGNHIKLSHFAGTVGQSDLEGDFDVDRGYARPLITAEFSSRKVVLTDLGGFLGTAPDARGTANQAGEHQAQLARREASPSLLPDEPFDLSKLRAADFRVHFKAERIEAQWAPLDRLEVNLDIDNGKLLLEPLNFGIGQGSIASSVLLDAQQNPIAAKASVDFRRVDLQRLMQATQRFAGAGLVGGRAEIEGRGNSPAAIAANGNGDLKLFMNGGNISALLVNLAGLDFGKSLLSALGLPDKTTLRCMISDFALQQGVLQTRSLVVDTDEANVLGHGNIDLRNNTVDYQIEQDPKHFSILALHAPINISGPLKNPSITPDPQQLSLRAGLALLTGLIGSVQLGLGEDNDCGALIKSAQQAAEAPSLLAPVAPHKAEGSAPVPAIEQPKTHHR